MVKIKKSTYKRILTPLLFFGFVFVFLNVNSVGFFTQDHILVQDVFAIPPNKIISTNQKIQTQTTQQGYLSEVDVDWTLVLPFAILRLIGLLIYFSTTLIDWILQPHNVDSILRSDALYSGWGAVRDMLNIFFIFFLLYSAFCTIFQISRYHIRSTWVMIVLMALLVNFSWPITRIMIDMSNVTMDYFLNGNNSIGLFSTFGNESKFVELMTGVQTGPGEEIIIQEKGMILPILMGIIFGFIFLITFLTLALLLFIRIVVFAMLLIFAPVGYILAAFPSTKAYASKWWDALLKQMLVGPILLFCLLVAVNVLSSITIDYNVQMGKSTTVVQHIVNFSLTIILIWSSITMAQSVGANGSEMAMNFANRAKGWGKKWGKAGAIGAVGFTAGVGDTMTGRNVSKGIARVHGAVSGVGQRFKNASTDFKDHYGEQKGIGSAYVQEIGTGIGTNQNASKTAKFFGKITGAGGDKDAIAAHKGKMIEAEKKRMKETPTNTAKNIKDEAKAQSIIEKKDNVSEQDIKDLIASLDRLDKDTQKLALKKARETGNGHIAYDAKMESLRNDVAAGTISRADAHNQAFQHAFGNKVDGKTWARNAEMIRRASADPEYVTAASDLQQKLNRSGFARDISGSAISQDTYNQLWSINHTHL